jgi:hypothetical protein
MSKQTAVEWVFEYLWENHNLSFSDNVLAKAKEMEKEQIIDAYCIGKYLNIDDREFGEQFYNETYGKSNS